MKNKYANEIVHLLIDRLPNFVPETTLIYRLRHMKEAEIKKLLDELVKNNQLEVRTDEQKISVGPIKYYRF